MTHFEHLNPPALVVTWPPKIDPWDAVDLARERSQGQPQSVYETRLEALKLLGGGTKEVSKFLSRQVIDCTITDRLDCRFGTNVTGGILSSRN